MSTKYTHIHTKYPKFHKFHTNFPGGGGGQYIEIKF